MWLVHGALRRPITILCAVLAMVISSALAIRRAPVDIFPNLGVRSAKFLLARALGDIAPFLAEEGQGGGPR